MPESAPPRPLAVRLISRFVTVTRARTTRGRVAATLVVAAVAVVLGAALLWLIGSTLGSDGVLGTLLVVSFVATLLVTLLVVLTQRDLHQQRTEFRRHRDAMEQRHRRQRAALIERTGSIVGQLREVQAELGALRRDVETAQSASQTQLGKGFEELDKAGPRLHLETQRQVQAQLNLQRLVTIDGRVPPLGGWAASADLMVLVLDEALSLRPRTIVECGSGASTLLFAMAARAHGLDARIVALEHLPEHQRATQELLHRHGLADRAEVRLAPLQPVSGIDHSTSWYAESALADLDEIGLLLVDGPPAATGRLARYPAVPLLREKLAADCVVIMDDLVREAEHDVAAMWRELLPDFEYEALVELQKRAGVFRRRR